MTTAKPSAANPVKADLGRNLARVDPSKLTKTQSVSLPVDVASDLQDSYNLFDKENLGVISIQQFKNILHNFGFSKMSITELANDLKYFDPDFTKRTGVDFDFLKAVVSYRYMKTGLQEECKEAFRVFDKKDRQSITIQDMKAVFDEYLDISKAELEEIYAECDKNNTGSISWNEFKKVYMS